MTDQQTALAELLRGAQRVLFFTGAGISTGSGIADYRGRTEHDDLAGLTFRIDGDTSAVLPPAADAALGDLLSRAD